MRKTDGQKEEDYAWNQDIRKRRNFWELKEGHQKGTSRKVRKTTRFSSSLWAVSIKSTLQGPSNSLRKTATLGGHTRRTDIHSFPLSKPRTYFHQPTLQPLVVPLPPSVLHFVYSVQRASTSIQCQLGKYTTERPNMRNVMDNVFCIVQKWPQNANAMKMCPGELPKRSKTQNQPKKNRPNATHAMPNT